MFVTDKNSKPVNTYNTFTGPGWWMDTSPYTPCYFVMPQFSQHKRDDDIWFSHPFFSAPQGYKLCLAVYANGFGHGKGTHISALVHLMKSENDDHLQWPFEYNVVYGVLNWKKDANHVIDTVPFKHAWKCYKERVTPADMAHTGYGHHKLLSHAMLYSNNDEQVQHLNEDCLCFQVLKVDPPK